jgi:hypothetical protein
MLDTCKRVRGYQVIRKSGCRLSGHQGVRSIINWWIRELVNEDQRRKTQDPRPKTQDPRPKTRNRAWSGIVRKKGGYYLFVFEILHFVQDDKEMVSSSAGMTKRKPPSNPPKRWRTSLGG